MFDIRIQLGLGVPVFFVRIQLGLSVPVFFCKDTIRIGCFCVIVVFVRIQRYLLAK